MLNTNYLINLTTYAKKVFLFRKVSVILAMFSFFLNHANV